MFKRLWAALTSLTQAVETLTASVQEANDNFRENLGLDHDEPKKLGKKKDN